MRSRDWSSDVCSSDREYRVTGPATAFKPSAEPLPQDPPHQMDDWDVVGYKEFRQMSQETTAFDAVITFKGERVLNARNSGTGGSKIGRASCRERVCQYV